VTQLLSLCLRKLTAEGCLGAEELQGVLPSERRNARKDDVSPTYDASIEDPEHRGPQLRSLGISSLACREPVTLLRHRWFVVDNETMSEPASRSVPPSAVDPTGC